MKKLNPGCCFHHTLTGLATLLAGGVLIIPSAEGSIIWDGPTITYTQPAPIPTQPANQDRLTPNIWLTRASSQGLFNAKTESAFSHHSSPQGTRWASGQLSNYASLTYSDWETWNGGNPPSMVGQDAVVHLTSEDIYLSIHFTAWGGSGGGFSYTRSTPTPPAPPILKGATQSGDGTLQLTFTNTPGYLFAVLGTTNLSLPLTNWLVLGQATYALSVPGSYQFTDPGAGTNQPYRFYLLRWP
jgi:hypothetical protein